MDFGIKKMCERHGICFFARFSQNFRTVVAKKRRLFRGVFFIMTMKKGNYSCLAINSTIFSIAASGAMSVSPPAART